MRDPIDLFLEEEGARYACDERAEEYAAAWGWRRFRRTNVFDLGSDDDGDLSVDVGGEIKCFHTRISRKEFGSEAEYLDALWSFLWDHGDLQEECQRLET